jgi:hypothetical protein
VSSWFGGRGTRAQAQRRPRPVLSNAQRVDFTELTPETEPFLGQAAYIQLEIFEGLARAVRLAPDLASKEGLSLAAGEALRKHHGLIEVIRGRGADPAEVMAPFAPALEEFRAATTGRDWWELILGIHLTSGILDDYFARLAAGLPADVAPRVGSLLGGPGAAPVLGDLLAKGIAEHPELSDRLALWGRRLVGDTLLIARSALREAASHERHEHDVEPVFTELIAAHTRRMDALGLTA